jgi:hypothetical protein
VTNDTNKLLILLAISEFTRNDQGRLTEADYSMSFSPAAVAAYTVEEKFWLFNILQLNLDWL